MEQEVFSFSESRINELAVSFADETEKSKEDFAIRYGVAKKTVDIILKKAITESICSDEIFIQFQFLTQTKRKENYICKTAR